MTHQNLPKKNTEIVYQCIIDLENAYGFAQRDAIIKETGLIASLVDEAIKTLRETDGSIYRGKKGYFYRVKKYNEETVSGTYMEDGRMKMEHGETIDILTPRMARAYVALLGGFILMHGR